MKLSWNIPLISGVPHSPQILHDPHSFARSGELVRDELRVYTRAGRRAGRWAQDGRLVRPGRRGIPHVLHRPLCPCLRPSWRTSWRWERDSHRRSPPPGTEPPAGESERVAIRIKWLLSSSTKRASQFLCKMASNALKSAIRMHLYVLFHYCWK